MADESRGILLLVEDNEVYLQDCLVPHFSPRWNVRASLTAPDAVSLVERASALAGAIVDWKLPGGNGFDVVDSIRRRFPTAPVLVLSAYLSPELVNGSYERGARFVSKDAPWGALERFEEELLLDGSAEPRLCRFLQQLRAERGLTLREMEILATAVADTDHRGDIATKLGISSDTVKHFSRSLISKLKPLFGADSLHDAAEAVRRALQQAPSCSAHESTPPTCPFRDEP